MASEKSKADIAVDIAVVRVVAQASGDGATISEEEMEVMDEAKQPQAAEGLATLESLKACMDSWVMDMGMSGW